MTMMEEGSGEENDLLDDKSCSVGDKRISFQALHSFVPDSPNAEDHPQKHPSRLREKVSTYAMDVQRRISVKELRHVVIEEDELSSETSDWNGVSTKLARRNAKSTGGNYDDEDMKRSDDTVSTNELFSLIENRTKEKRKLLVDKFISALTLHGYAQFHEATGIRKVLWALILAAMAVFIVRLTYLSYRPENFYKQVIEFETEKVNEVNFPTITICNFLPVYTKGMYKRFPINLTEAQYRRFYYRVLSNRMVNHKAAHESERQTGWLKELNDKGYRSYSDVLELFEKHKETDINSIFVRKIMKRHKCMYENKPCDFKKLFRTVYRHVSQSLCQQFNFYELGKRGLISTGNDRENGLFMFWDISGLNYYYDDGLHGLLMEIHPYGTPHHLVDHRRSVYLEPGACTNIDIEEVITKMLPYPFKPNCEEKESKIVKDYPYSKATCELECFLEKGLEICGCIPDQFAQYARNIRSCNISEMRCVFKASSDIHCHGCPMKCESIDYRIFTSRLGIGNDWVHQIIGNTSEWKGKSKEETTSYINRNIVGFRIGFKTLEMQIQAYKEAVPWYERLSMLGGMMGLLLGFSVITGFEFIFFLFDYLYITIKYRCTQEYLSAVLQQENLKTARQRRSERQPKNEV